MLGTKMETLLAVAEQRSFTRAAQALSLTQPAVSRHISQLEQELGATLFLRRKGSIRLTPEGELVVKYARRMKAQYAKLQSELQNARDNLTQLRVGITHTAESNLTAEVLARCSSRDRRLGITILTDTVKNLYDMLENDEIDLAIVDGTPGEQSFCSRMLDTDDLVCVMSNNHPLAGRDKVTLAELRRERMILRLPTSATRMLFSSALERAGDSIDNFTVAIEVDNIATIKDLIRKDLGVSVLPKSACMDELRKEKLTALPIENLNMVRETRLVYHRDFVHPELLEDITRAYRETARLYRG